MAVVEAGVVVDSTHASQVTGHRAATESLKHNPLIATQSTGSDALLQIPTATVVAIGVTVGSPLLQVPQSTLHSRLTESNGHCDVSSKVQALGSASPSQVVAACVVVGLMVVTVVVTVEVVGGPHVPHNSGQLPRTFGMEHHPTDSPTHSAASAQSSLPRVGAGVGAGVDAAQPPHILGHPALTCSKPHHPIERLIHSGSSLQSDISSLVGGMVVVVTVVTVVTVAGAAVVSSDTLSHDPHITGHPSYTV